jgi:hypothetical protein
MSQEDDFEKMILGIIQDRPASAEGISLVTSIPTNTILMKLRKMEKWNLVKPVTRVNVIMWSQGDAVKRPKHERKGVM